MIVLTFKEHENGRAIVEIKEEQDSYIPEKELGEEAAKLVWNDDKTEATLVLPEDVTCIGSINEMSTFGVENPYEGILESTDSELAKVMSVKLPASLKFIKKNFFSQFPNLRNIEFPLQSSIERVYPKAFANCGNVEEIVIPDNANQKEVEIMVDAFVECTNVRKIQTPANSNIILYVLKPFKGCERLEELHLKGRAKIFSPKVEHTEDNEESRRDNNVNAMGMLRDSRYVQPFARITEDNNIFCDFRAVTLPSSITTIDKTSFARSEMLEQIIIPASVTDIDDYTFEECDRLKSVTIPDSVKRIGAGAFQYCNSLEDIVIPDSVTKIEEMAFFYCENLRNIVLSKNIRSIKDSTFSSCEALKKITIPKQVRTIGSRAFSGCSTLAEVTILNGNLSEIKRFAFYSARPHSFDDVPQEPPILTFVCPNNPKVHKSIEDSFSSLSCNRAYTIQELPMPALKDGLCESDVPSITSEVSKEDKEDARAQMDRDAKEQTDIDNQDPNIT